MICEVQYYFGVDFLPGLGGLGFGVWVLPHSQWHPVAPAHRRQETSSKVLSLVAAGSDVLSKDMPAE